MTDDITMDELIKSAKMAGREALEYLDRTGKYVFHGTPSKLTQLEPRQARSNGQPDGEPAVAATSNINTAIFRAIVHRSRYPEMSKGYYSAWSSQNGEMIYMVTEEWLNMAHQENVRGYVYAMDKAPFAPYRGEMRAYEAIHPNFQVVVTTEDLPSGIKLFKSAAELQKFYESVGPSQAKKDESN